MLLAIIPNYSRPKAPVHTAAKKNGQKHSSNQKKSQKSRKNQSAAPSIVTARQKELASLRREIEQTRRQVSNLAKKETVTIKTLTVVQKQKQLVSQRMDLLGQELDRLRDTMTSIQKRDSSLRARLFLIQTEYSGIVRRYYADNRSMQFSNPADLMGDAGQQGGGSAMRLPIYMKSLKEKLNYYTGQIMLIQQSLARQQSDLAYNSSLHEKMLRDKENEQKRLQTAIREQKTTLDKIKADKALLQAELAKKESSARKVAAMIAQLIQEEIQRARRIEEARRRQQEKAAAERKRQIADARTRKQQHSPASSPHKEEKSEKEERIEKEEKVSIPTEHIPQKSSFAGAFRWPAQGRRILRGFGEYRNPLTNTVMDNPGIDIAAAEGSPVYCAAPGTVSLVMWLPGYNSVVIVEHGNTYRTVYANLSSARVQKGQQISSGSIIGSTTESVDGEFLHFEIWKGKSRLNPVKFLR
jgi:murein DD-endopeptidase MepM/ murein hydrolase activator NlpD